MFFFFFKQKTAYEIIGKGLRQAYERAVANSKMKSDRKNRWEALGKSLRSSEFAPVKACQDRIAAVYRISPIAISLEEVSRLTQEVSRAVASHDSRVKMNQIIVETSLTRELFVSSEGANIDRAYALTQGLCWLAAVGNSGSQKVQYDGTGHQGGGGILKDGMAD